MRDMVPASHAAHNIEITAESLQEDLTRLELQRQALERELAAVLAHLDTIRRTLSALEVAMADPTGVSIPWKRRGFGYAARSS
jgi:hypothetical protein